MATIVRLTGTSFAFKSFDFEPRWPANSFYEDARMRRTDLGWLDYLGAMTADEPRAFRDEHQLKGRDSRLDRILNSGWTGKVLIQCLEWEGCNQDGTPGPPAREAGRSRRIERLWRPSLPMASTSWKSTGWRTSSPATGTAS